LKLFAPLYDRALQWAAHRHAPRYLAGLSFAESSFFPVPPDVMLIPMSMTRPKCWFAFALLATAASTVGGLFGYLLGHFFLELLMPYLQQLGYMQSFERAQAWFREWGVWVVFVAGFSPIPYKVFTLSAGALSMALAPFILASFVGRGTRFFLVAAFMAWAGPTMEPVIRRYVEWLGWLSVLVLVMVFVWVKWLR
jgi:membrane protein YqaA with SNARE-associated domain